MIGLYGQKCIVCVVERKETVETTNFTQAIVQQVTCSRFLAHLSQTFLIKNCQLSVFVVVIITLLKCIH